MQAMRQFGELLDLHLLVVSSGEVGLCVKTISGKHPLEQRRKPPFTFLLRAWS